MTRPGIEPQSPGPLANTLPTKPMARLKDSSGTILTRSWGVHAFLEATIQKMNILARLEFELTYYDVTAQNVSQYDMSTFVSVMSSVISQLRLWNTPLESLQRRKSPLLRKKCPGYDSKLHLIARVQSTELWERWITSSQLLLLGPLKPGVDAPDRVLSMNQIEMFYM